MSKFSELEIADLKVLSAQTFLKATKAIFDHADRLRIAKIVADSPKSFLEIKRVLNISSSTTYSHLKALAKEAVIYKTEEGKYHITILGKFVLDSISRSPVEFGNQENPFLKK